jgi:hypothetical protein
MLQSIHQLRLDLLQSTIAHQTFSQLVAIELVANLGLCLCLRLGAPCRAWYRLLLDCHARFRPTLPFFRFVDLRGLLFLTCAF